MKKISESFQKLKNNSHMPASTEQKIFLKSNHSINGGVSQKIVENSSSTFELKADHLLQKNLSHNRSHLLVKG